MIHKYLVRYVILILVLLLCAGAAWYLTNVSGDPRGDVVLAYPGDPAVRAADEVIECLRTAPGNVAGAYFDAEEKEAV